MKHKISKIATVIAVIIVAVFIFVAPVRKMVFDAVFSAMLAPEKIAFSENTALDISKNTGAHVPSSATFTAGYKYPGQEPTYIYVFSLTLPKEVDENAVYPYICEALQIDGTYGSPMLLSNTSVAVMDGYLKKLDLSYTYMLSHTGDAFSEIYYNIMEDTVEIAFVYSL